MKTITSAGPSITQAEIDLVAEAAKYGWQDKMNWYIDQFITEFSGYVGIKYCLPTAHCTDAIHLAMVALEIGPGDEVIVPDLTWVASASPIIYVGGTPVFADVDPVTWCISAESIERRISPRTKAVVVVDLLGNLPEWGEILYLCQRRGIRVIEDAAEGLGATYEGQRAGTFGEVSLFSFNATKLIMSGQGGALCSDDSEIYRKAKVHCHHGIDKESTGRYYWSTALGYNYNWTNLQAALALAQLRRIDELIAYKKWLFLEYQKGLCDSEGLQLSATKPNVDPTNWINAVIVDSHYHFSKEELCQSFAENGIDMRPLFYPVSSMPTFLPYVSGKNMRKENPVAYDLSERGICLPNGYNLSEVDVRHVCNTFNTILDAHK